MEACLASGDLQTASLQANEAEKLFPDDLRAGCLVARVLTAKKETGGLEQAQKIFQKALKANPALEEAIVGQARLLMETQKLDEALKLYPPFLGSQSSS